MRRKKKLREVREKRREEHECNRLKHRARGLPSRSALRRFVGQSEEAHRIWRLTGKILGFPKREKKNAQLMSKIEDNSCLGGDEEEIWEESDDDEDGDDEEGNEDRDCDHGDDQENARRWETKEMEYNDASGKIAEVLRKWGKWFNSVRKDDEEEEVLF
jgi:hypothetical protein